MRRERPRLLSLFGCCLAVLPALVKRPPLAPATAAAQLRREPCRIEEPRWHIWRDTPPLNADGTVNGYIEIARGDRRKWEFDMRANARAIDRMMPGDVGGYPVNYGFVPQTISYDGDPFDVLVLGPPIDGGRLVRGVIVGLMFMEDEKGLDSKVVLSRLRRDGQPLYAADGRVQQRNRRLLQALQAARAGQVLEGAWLGIASPKAWRT